MHLAALLSFLLAAALGITMAVNHVRGVPSGTAFGIAHGLAAVSGLVFLITSFVFLDVEIGWWILAGFLLTAAGGVYLFTRQQKGEPWPGLVLVAHGSLAILSIVLLAVWIAGPRGQEEGVPVPVEAVPD